MLRTEEEARKCWCPFARVCATQTDSAESAAHVGYNRVYVAADGPANFEEPTSRNPMVARCIASECMAWRWQMVETNASKQRHHGIGTYPPPLPVYEQTERGYCGLASGFIA